MNSQPTEADDTPTPDAPESTEAEQLDPAIEAEARSNGWRDKSEHKGDPEDWLDARTFVQKGRQLNPILRKSNERLRAELNEAKAQISELNLTTKQFATEFAKMKENAYKRAISDLRAQRRDALQSDDLALVDDLEDRIDALKDEKIKVTTPPKEEPAKPAAPDMTIFNEWHASNKWFDQTKEPALYDIAEEIADRLTRSNPSLKGRDFLDEVTSRVRARHPEKFTNPRREKSPYEGGGARGETRGAKSYSALPSEAKKACDDFVKQGIMTREQFIDIYEWDE